MPVGDLIQVRRGTTAEWAAENPVLAAGEPGVDVDTGRFKVGDGVTPWEDLARDNRGDVTYLLCATGSMPGGTTLENLVLDVDHWDADYAFLVPTSEHGNGGSFDVDLATGIITILETGLYSHVMQADFTVAAGDPGQSSLLIMDLREAGPDPLIHLAVPSFSNESGDANGNINTGANTQVAFWRAGTPLKVHFQSTRLPWQVTQVIVGIERIA